MTDKGESKSRSDSGYRRIFGGLSDFTDNIKNTSKGLVQTLGNAAITAKDATMKGSIHVYTHTHMHTYIHAYMRTYKHIHTYIRTY